MRPASKKTTKDFCRCIKKVRAIVKTRSGTKEQSSQSGKTLQQKKRFSAEQAAIAICTKSVLQTKGKTLRKFKCRNGKLFTQKKKY